MDIEVKNESFSSRITLTEKCRYYVSSHSLLSPSPLIYSNTVSADQVHSENSDWTCYEQAASLEIHSFFGFESTIEKLAMKQYSQNVASGKEVIEHFIKALKNEGIIYIPLWKPSEVDESDNKEDK